MSILNRGGIPIIDLGDAPHKTREAIGLACREWGVFQVVGHGIPEELTARMDTQRRRFFAKSRETKRQVLRSAENSWGYYDRELTKQNLDWKEVFDFGRESASPRPGIGDGRNLWPQALPDFPPTMLAYLKQCETVAFRVLGLLCESLGLSGRRLHEHFEADHSSFLRLNHYPACPDPAPPDAPTLPQTGGSLGVHHHTDAGALTLVEQTDVAGLQVLRDGVWTTVPPVRGALVVNLADMFQVWSNDAYLSPLHRVVVDRATPRYSAPFFFNPSYETDCAPLEELVDAEHPPRYRTINWGEFRRARADGDYADFGEEIQISQFAL